MTNSIHNIDISSVEKHGEDAGVFCHGFRRSYVKVYGMSEMKPVPDSEAIRKRKEAFGPREEA